MKSFLTILLLTLLGSIAARSQIVQPTDTADSFVSAANGDSNYGAAGSLSVAGSGLGEGEFDSLLKYDFSSTKASLDALYGAGHWTVQSVTLQLTALVPSNPIFNASHAGNFSIGWLANDSWTEGNGSPNGASTTGGITYNTLPAIVASGEDNLGHYAFGGATSGTFTYSLGLDSAFVADLMSGGPVSLLFTPDDASVSYLFGARTNPTTGARPVLTVVAVPEPSTLGLGSLCAGLLACRRRRSRG